LISCIQPEPAGGCLAGRGLGRYQHTNRPVDRNGADQTGSFARAAFPVLSC
jgi:hypothetical protein